jgi:nicotinamide-nucleotide amidase
VLRGEVTNGNAAYLSDRLFELGFALTEHAVVADEPAAMRAALLRLASRVDVLLVTGGLGPTEDDRTVDVICDLLGVGAVPHEASLASMKDRFARLGFELTPNNLRQVRVPVGALALPNGVGIAPGFRVRLPAATAARSGADAYFLPGVPREMERIFGDHIAPALAAAGGAAIARQAVRTWHVLGMGESHIDHRLAGLLDETGAAGVATLHFRTAAPENHVKVVVRAPDADRNRELLDRVDAEVRRRLGPVVYGVDADTLPSVLGRTLRARGATLGLAESCTGGYAGQLVTSEPGASEYFHGAIVAYANAVKTGVLGVRPETLAAHGAVSEPCAAEMAEGARRVLGTTVGVSITGIAGRDGEAPVPGEKAVGTVCFGVAGPNGTRTETRQLPPGRARIRRAAAHHALDLARRCFDQF